MGPTNTEDQFHTISPETLAQKTGLDIKRSAAWLAHVDASPKMPIDSEDRNSDLEPSEDTDDVIHNLNLRDLEEAWEFETERCEMFKLARRDNEIDDVIIAGLSFAIGEMQNPRATVCGVVIGTMAAIFNNHRAFTPYLQAPARPFPRRISAIVADIEREGLNNLNRLKYELELAVDMEALATGGMRDTTEVMTKLRFARDLRLVRMEKAMEADRITASDGLGTFTADETGQPAPANSAAAVAELRMAGSDYPLSDKRFIAVDGLEVNEEVDIGKHQRFWFDRIREVGTVAPHFAELGSTLWKDLELEVPVELTASMLSLEGIDKETADAAQIALFSAFNSTLGVVDLETMAIALTAFAMAHPAITSVQPGGLYEKPFGSNTRYMLATIGE